MPSGCPAMTAVCQPDPIQSQFEISLKLDSLRGEKVLQREAAAIQQGRLDKEDQANNDAKARVASVRERGLGQGVARVV